MFSASMSDAHGRSVRPRPRRIALRIIILGCWILLAASVGAAPATGVTAGPDPAPGPTEASDADVAATEALRDLIEGYGKTHRTQYAGAYIEGGVLAVGLFTDDLEVHEAAIRSIAGDGAAFAVVPATVTMEELQALANRVSIDESWFGTIDAELAGVAIDVARNAVIVKVTTFNAAAFDLVMEHFAVDPAVLRVVPSGLAQWNGGYGSLSIEVTRDPSVVARLYCRVTSVLPFALGLPLEYAVDDTGRCAAPRVPATTYTIQILAGAGPDALVEKEAEVSVPVNGVAEVVVHVGAPVVMPSRSSH